MHEPVEPVGAWNHRVLKLACTIADLAGREQIQSVRLANNSSHNLTPAIASGVQ
ncbi:MAG: hypothetical protein ACOYYU_20070 [Chloroflexota bacterium]